MPYPTRVRPEEIVAEGRRLLEESGLEGVSMRELGRRLGVKAPSLYFHVESREALLGLIMDQGMEELGQILATAAPESTPLRTRLHAMADAYELFANANRQLFALLFGPRPRDVVVNEQLAELASAPLVDSVSPAAAQSMVLAVSQAAWSMIHGYTALALADQFTTGGDPAAAVHLAIDLLVDGLERMRQAAT
jgi:AcrR family transcriptional regulator